MLNDKAPSRLGFYIVIGFLVTVLCFFVYKTADYKQAYKWRGVEINMMEDRIEKMEQAAKEISDIGKRYYMAVVEYKKMFDRGIVMPKDGVISVKKGTIIIPPRQEPSKEIPESQQ